MNLSLLTALSFDRTPQQSLAPRAAGACLALVATIGLALFVSAPASRAQSDNDAEMLLREAMHTEVSDGDLERAIDVYRTIIEEYGNERPIAAQALLRMGMSYEKLGNQEARVTYERLLNEYADQAEPATEARSRLASLPAALSAASDGAPSTDNGVRLAWRVAPRVDAGGAFEFSSVSPDGRRVAYREREFLRIRDLESGDVTTLAFNAWDNLAWSPDNRTIALTSFDTDGLAFRGRLQILDTATGAVTVPESTSSLEMSVLDWSSDGYLLCNLIRPDGSLSLVRVATDSWEVIPLLSQGWSQGATGVFSPDGKHVAFTVIEEGTSKVDVMAVDGSERHRLANDAAWPLWSPDGQSIIYRSSGSAWAVSMLDGVPQGMPRWIRLPGDMWAVQWTADGSLFLVLQTNTRRTFRVGIDPDNGTATGEVYALSGSSTGNSSTNGWLRWSPDMTRVAFADRVLDVYSLSLGTMKRIPLGPDARSSGIWWDATGEQIFTVPYDDNRIFAIDVDSGEARPLFAPISSANRFHTNADGSMMVFYRGMTPERRLILSRTGEPEGLVLASVPDPAGTFSNSIRPKFSPDGSLVLFGRHLYDAETPNSSLWVASTAGSGLRKVVEVSAQVRDAYWSPDGRYIAYPDGQQPIVVEVESGLEHEIEIPTDWGRNWILDWSPDGRWLAVRVEFDQRLELWTRPDFRVDEASQTAQP